MPNRPRKITKEGDVDPRPKTAAGEGEGEAELNEYIGKKIREIRDIRHLSAETVAKHLKMDRTNLSHIETGRNKVTAVVLYKLAALFRCPVDRFFPPVSSKYGISHSDVDILVKEDPRIEAMVKKCFPIQE